MSFLDRFRRQRPRREDPTFGVLTYERSWWSGKVEFAPCSGEVAVGLESDENGPTEAQRSRFRELVPRYRGLLPLIGDALWELYRPVREELASDEVAGLGPADASGMVEHTTLFGIDIRGDGTIELGYAFGAEVGWDDAMFNVAIEGWTPRPVSLDD